MISSDDFVQLSDDDNINLIESNKETENKSTKVIDTIVIDDESLSQRSTQENNNIIEIYDSENTPEKQCFKSQIINYDVLYKENKLFTEYLDKCMDLENSEGMLRIINKTLIKVYEDADENYRNSSDFRKELLKFLGLLETDPLRKFSNVKNLCETLKEHKHHVKRRAKLITLTTNLKDNNNPKNQLKRNGEFADRHVKRPKIETIVLDDDISRKESDPIINLDDDVNDVIMLDEPLKNQEENDNKENSEESRFLEPQVEVFWESGRNNVPDTSITVIEPKELRITFTPHPPNEEELQKRVKSIEAEIACYKQAIAKLDEAEVNSDSWNSPYIRSEKLKAKIVTLYKELCTLTGEQPIKQRKVRLQVRDGHPPGPVRLLEAFINNNIGSDGTPPFPDFDEVVQCVAQANLQDGLGWSKIQIVQEASALFTQCGRALQKRRQRREYRDLMSLVKLEITDDDPAENDPELLAKLEENRKIAMKKENDLLERYVMMQALPSTKTPEPSSRNAQEETTIPNGSNHGIDTDSDFDNLTPIPSSTYTQEETSIPSCNNHEDDTNSDFGNVIPITNYVSSVSCNNEGLARGKPYDFTEVQALPLQVNSNLVGQGDPNNKYIAGQPNFATEQSKLNVLCNISSSQIRKETNPKTDYGVSTSKGHTDLLGSNPEGDMVLISECQIVSNSGQTVFNVERQTVSKSGETVSNSCQIVSNACKIVSNSDNQIVNNSENQIVNNSENQIINNSGQVVYNSERQIVSYSKGQADNLQNPESGDVQPIHIKQEPIDVAALLSELGDNFSACIVDILDPFLVIEISSDSSDDEL